MIPAVIALMFMWLRPKPFEREYSRVIYMDEAGQTGTLEEAQQVARDIISLE
ncbi:hypothetical protein [Paenibacillus camerounensis]|uniref:hypothetical protein n=1 Tax=Paenibacillus camerounensis TaxID=1243663 RepID=UPI000A97C703|nr:hypothetical protein [Paenibacillus camerounensis]